MKRVLVLVVGMLLAAACSGPPPSTPDVVATLVAEDLAVAATLTALAPTPTATPSPTPTPAPTLTATPTATQSPTATPIQAPTLTLADLPPARLVRTIPAPDFLAEAPQEGAYDARWSPNGRFLAVGYYGGFLIYDTTIWQVEDGGWGSVAHSVFRIAWFSHGAKLLLAGFGLMEYTRGSAERLVIHSNTTWDVALQPGDGLIAHCSDLEPGNDVARLQAEGGGPSFAVAGLKDTDGNWVQDDSGNVYIAQGSQAAIYDRRAAAEAFAWTQGGAYSRAAAWSPDGRWLAAGIEEGVMFIDSTTLGTTAEDITGSIFILPMPAGLEALFPISDLAWSPDGARLAAAGISLPVWDVESRDLLYNLQTEPGFSWAISWAPDGRTLATAGDDGAIILWDAETGEQLQLLRKTRDAVTSLDWSPDGRWLAAADRAGQVLILELSP